VYSFIETKLFSRLVSDYLSDQEYARLQDALVRDPEAGSVIPGSGGVRKFPAAILRRIKDEIEDANQA